jgi:hypothetical protein
MGGNALSMQTIRLPAARYQQLEAQVVATLRAAFPGRRIEAILAYANKPDFGDMDLLIEDIPGYDARAIAACLDACDIVPNGDVTSIGLPLVEGVFQIDLLKTPSDCFDFAARYFGFNDLGNLLGRVAHKFGAKFSHRGLLYPMKDADNAFHLLAEITITTDFSCALRLLGYDPARYESLRNTGGFRTLDDIFAYVVTSKYVNRAIYLLENVNHKSRMRDAKRPTYNAFLDWLAAQPPTALPAWPWTTDGTPEHHAQQQAFLHSAFAACPGFEREYGQVLRDWEKNKAIKRRYNGKLAGEASGVSGKELGQLMTRVRQHFADQAAFERFFLEASDTMVTSFYRDMAAAIA